MVGSPTVAATAAAMADTSRVYVYTGSESGYTAGNWYYYDGSAWVSGGVYNATAVQTDTTLTVAGAAADAKATGDAIDELKSAIDYFVSEGYTPTEKTVTWFRAYVDANGVIRASQASQTALIPLTTGERVVVATANNNITIIGTTTAESVAVGDSITPVENTTSGNLETHSYTAETDVNVVVCVYASNYSINFYRVSPVLESIETNATDAVAGFEHTAPVANGSFSGSGTTTGATNRIRTGLIPIFEGEKIVIENGSLEHAIGMWEGSVSVSTIRRNDNAFISTTETITADYSGYIVIVFRKSNNGTLTPADFDGDIELYETLPYRNKVAIDGILGTSLPDYYEDDDYLSNKIARINQLGKVGDDVFVFITDIHWELNAKHSPALIKTLNDKCAIHKVFNGGDVADASNLDVYKKYRKSVDGRTYHATGNHDWFSPADGKDLYYGMDSANNDQIGNPFKHYWFVDNVQQKIRYITLNCFDRAAGSTTLTVGYDNDQISWFENTALDLPSGDWDVIVFTHFIKTTTIPVDGGSDICTAIDAFNADSSHTGKILAVFQGHTHWDGIYHTTGGVPVITTTCDKWDLSNETDTIPAAGIAFREQGTIKEQAFDVVILNRALSKFTLIRIGAPAQDNVDKYRTDTGFTWIGTLQEREVSYGS